MTNKQTMARYKARQRAIREGRAIDPANALRRLPKHATDEDRDASQRSANRRWRERNKETLAVKKREWRTQYITANYEMLLERDRLRRAIDRQRRIDDPEYDAKRREANRAAALKHYYKKRDPAVDVRKVERLARRLERAIRAAERTAIRNLTPEEKKLRKRELYREWCRKNPRHRDPEYFRQWRASHPEEVERHYQCELDRSRLETIATDFLRSIDVMPPKRIDAWDQRLWRMHRAAALAFCREMGLLDMED